MQIRDLFVKPIDRPINGVIKADQHDPESIWQELDEYVVTNQLAEYFRSFFDAYLAASDNPKDPVLSSRMGVWVSGFFGSGKSHFIKILSYLLGNIEAINPSTNQHKRAIEFFDAQKIKDSLLLADIARATRMSADVILFNIDAKADSKSDRDVILQVFLRVFNEKLGFSGDAPHIASMERHLLSQGVYDLFQQEFQGKNGAPWVMERDAVDFLRDDIVYALSKALNISEESASLWFETARDDFRINIENFAKLIRDYLNTKPPEHRIIFLVDEVGQFIGDNTQLMLTLQTITEQLGTLCQGRAWVVVTSQEDIDAAIGDANKAKSQDFSKIQGRFHTRLSLASSNTDEVIGKRLLSKTEEAHVLLRDVFAQNGDIINNQLAFQGNSVTMRGYKDSVEFVSYYPLAPYQFSLLQKVFESIRKVGATGKHLSKGERSLLDAFQSAAKCNSDRETDALVPLYDFYPSIESFIDTGAKLSIDEAPQNPALESYDILLLKGLFLIRYIPDIVRPSVDNLATLFLSEIDADKLALKRTIAEGLNRLERQRLVNRSGELWYFLTNEERDVAREIGHVDISSAEKSRLLMDLIFEEIFGGQTKVRHRETKSDYEFNRLLDGTPWRQVNHSLSLEIITPMGDDYERLSDGQCILRSHDRALIRIKEVDRLDTELTLYQQIEKYIVSPKASHSATSSIKRILSDRKDENRDRRSRLIEQLTTVITAGDFYAMGQKLALKSTGPGPLLDELVNYLVTNTYSKLLYLKVRQTDPIAEIKAVLTVDDIGQHALDLNAEEGNPLAVKEIRDHLQIVASNERVLLSDVIEKFSGIPWGWKPESEIVLLIARLFMAGEIKLVEGGDLDPRGAIEPLTKSVRYRHVSILKRKIADASDLRRARDLHKAMFSSLAREEEDGLVADFKVHFNAWLAELKSYLPNASLPGYPGKAIIEKSIARIGQLLAIRDSFEFIANLVQTKDEWLDLSDDISEVLSFYQMQSPTWIRMLEALRGFKDNTDILHKNGAARSALANLELIRSNPSPYGQVSHIAPLIATVATANDAIASQARSLAMEAIDRSLFDLQNTLDDVKADSHLSNRALLPLQQLKISLGSLSSVPKIQYLERQIAVLQDDAMDLIAKESSPALQVVCAPASPAYTSNVLNNTVPTPQPQVAAIKPIKIVLASAVVEQSYLETEAEVDGYLDRLKQKILIEIRAGGRVRVQ